MAKYQFTGKQAKNLDLHLWPETVIIEDGAIRSGKSLSIAYGFLGFMNEFDRPTRFLFAAPEVGQIRNVMLPYLRDACEDLGVPYGGYNTGSKTAQVGRHIIHLQHAKTTGSGEAIRGLTLGGVWIDEATEVDPDFVQIAIGRCSLDDPPPKIILSCNPKGAHHWLKTEYIDRPSEHVRRLAFELSDNPNLSARYIEQVKSQLTGTALLRDIHGQWVDSSGLIFPELKPVPLDQLPSPPIRYALAIDHATSSVTSCLLIASYSNETHAVVDEWRHDARDSVIGELTPDEQAKRIWEWCDAREITISGIVIDPAAAHMRVALNRIFGLKPVLGNNEVVPGIYKTQAWLGTGKMQIADHLAPVLREMGSYAWDDKWAEKGEDKPVKIEDHACDALRYFVASVGRRRARAAL